MNDELTEISERVLEVGCIAFAEENAQALFFDSGREDWEHMVIVNALLFIFSVSKVMQGIPLEAYHFFVNGSDKNCTQPLQTGASGMRRT